MVREGEQEGTRREAGSASGSNQETGTSRSSRTSGPLAELDRVLDDLFSRGLSSWPLRWGQPLWDRLAAMEPRMPRVDVLDREKEILVRAEVPGIDRKDLDVTISGNTVTIKGERRSESETEEADYYRCEIARGAIARTVTLPCDVDTEKASARFADGMLELTLPKVKESRRRRIEVQ